MYNECSIIDYTSGEPRQCKKGVVMFGYCWEHLPQWYKDALRLTQREADYFKAGEKLPAVANQSESDSPA